MLNISTDKNIPLSTKISHYFPEAAEAQDPRWSDISIYQLMSHSAGFDRLKSVDPMTIHAVKPWCPSNLEKIKPTRLDFDPGKDYGYSNLSYCLLGLIIEKETGLPYREVIEKEFLISNRNIKFIDGPYLMDEVKYDFRHSNIYNENYYKYFNFQDLSSSAGLSGSAQNFAKILKELLDQKKLTAIEQPIQSGCDFSKKSNCYGAAVFRYKKTNSTLTVNVQKGFLFGSPSLAVIDSFGGVTVWTGSGNAPTGNASNIMLDKIYDFLDDQYKSQLEK